VSVAFVARWSLPIALLLVSGAFAQEEPAISLPEVRVIAPASPRLAVDRTPAARVEALTGREIEATRSATLPEALARLPGVTLADEQGNAFQPTLTLRGFSASSVTGLPQGVSVFVDGVRLNEPTVEEVNFDLIPLEDVERIEVVRGASVLYGRNTLAGAINLITRRGQDIREIVPSIAVGSFGHQDYRVRLSGGLRPLDYYVSLTQRLDDGYRDFTSARLSRGFAKLGWRDDRTDLALSYQYSANRIEQAGSLPENILARDRSANFTPDFFKPELHLAILNGRHALAENTAIEINAFVRALDTEQFNANLIGPNSRLLNSVLSTGGRAQLSHRSLVAGRDNTVVIGGEYTRNHVTSRTFTESSGTRSLDADLADTQHAAGVYAQDSLVLARDALVPGSKFTVTIAGRWDLVRHDIDDRLGGASGGVHTFDRFNPRAGAEFAVGDRLSAYASYAEAFRAPAFLELTCAGPGAVCPGLQAGVAPDPPLSAVKARTYEIGVRGRPLHWLDVEVSGFRTDVRDDIFAMSPTGTTGVFFQNVGGTRRQGIEIGLRGRFAPAVETYVNYGFTRATFRDRAELATPVPPGTETVRPGDSLALVPRHRVNAGLAYHPWPWATLSLDLRYVSPQVLRGDEQNRQRPLDAYWVADVGASVKIQRVEAFARINNVLNRKYETFGTFAINGREPDNPVERFLTPAPPINFLLGAQYVF
jgi:iron complex outermembrane receptor protein